MALTKKTGVDHTLEVVRDLTKFKKRIQQLADAEKASDVSVAKAQTEVADCRLKMASMVKDANQKVKAGQKVLKATADAVEAQRVAAVELNAKAVKHEKALSRREDRLKQDRGILKTEQAAASVANAAFASKVERFEKAAKAACAVID